MEACGETKNDRSLSSADDTIARNAPGHAANRHSWRIK